MRRTTGWLAGVAVLMLAGPVRADDVIGTWKVQFVSPDGKTRESWLKVTRVGNVLRGDHIVGRVAKPARDVGYENGVLRFRVDGEYAGQGYVLTYQGKAEGDTLRGAVRWKFGWVSGSTDFRGEKVAALGP